MMQEAPDADRSNSKNLSNRMGDTKKSASIFSFKNLDFFQKIEEDYKVQTSGGATLSLAGWVIIAILVLGQINNYLKPQYKEHMVVDTTLGQQLRVNLDITFHALSCDEVHLDAMDVAGDNQLNIEHAMTKQRLSPKGIPIGLPMTEKINKPTEHRQQPTNSTECLSCFGAETPVRRCCNSCDELKEAYSSHGWSTQDIIKNAPQCHDEFVKKTANLVKGEGCRVNGLMTVNKVAGNFHVAHGESIVRDGHHIHQFIPAEAPGFNVSHTVNSLSFGTPYPGMKRKNPMMGVTKICGNDTGTGLFQYFIKVLPTIYTNSGGEKVLTNQYTFTERFRPIAMPGKDVSAVLPGIFFVYEMSPFMIEAQEIRVPFLHLLTKLCAIVGGVFTVLGITDSLLFKLQKVMKLK